MTCVLAARIPRFKFFSHFCRLLEWPCHVHLTFYHSLEGWAKFIHLMLWGIQLSNLCIVELCTASDSNISSVTIYLRILTFQSISNPLLCFSGPPWTWRAAALPPHHVINCERWCSSLQMVLARYCKEWCVHHYVHIHSYIVL